MRKVFFIFGLFFFLSSFGQGKVYKYYLYLNSFKSAHTFTKKSGKMIYSGTNESERVFFSNYEILEYKQAFVDGIDPAVLNIFYLETTSSNLATSLGNKFPEIYLKSDDITNWKIEYLNYYPNDYGTSSPNTNLGFNYNKKEFDYINVPEAWDITVGNPNIKIGISDEPIYYTDPDLSGKITIIDGYTQQLIPNSHGTGVAATAAARGNNGYASVGVCMECSIVEGPIGYGDTSQTIYSNLYKIAKKGARVINMSWFNGIYYNMDINSPYYFNPSGEPIKAEQIVINDLVNNYGVTMVAAAGNHTSFGTPASNDNNGNPPFGELFVFPASYDNVISVSSIHHKNAYSLPLDTAQLNYLGQPIYCCTSPWFPVYLDLEDSVSHSNSGLDPMNPVGVLRNGYYQNATNPDGFQYSMTLNRKVDILAPGFFVYWHASAILNQNNLTNIGTSISSPTVAGTIGLMLSVNDCLIPQEIESILKLSTKDIENMPINQNYVGYVGAGKLEVGDSVIFANEMKKVNGNAVIDNHIFNRFDFNLNKINHDLTIENVTFKDACTANFTAKNQIHLLPGTRFAPNSLGNVHLGINQNINITCSPIIFAKNTKTNALVDEKDIKNNVVLYPNPNSGLFNLYNIDSDNFESDSVNVEIVDLNGRSLFKKEINKQEFNDVKIDLSYFSSGLYLVKIYSLRHSEEIKFIKN